MPMMDDLTQSTGFRTEAFAKASRHSKWVKFLKFALPVSALAIVAGFSLTAMQARMLPEIDVAGFALEGGKIVMDNPKLNGVTGDNQPYMVEATRALQSATDVNDVELEGITARIPFGKDTTASVQAPVGHLNNTTQILTLKGGFDLTTSDGLVAKLQDAVFDFGVRSLKTDSPVDIKRQGTHIQADSMTITNGGASLVFENRVRMTLLPDQTEQTKEPANGG
jgi:lipopolysaccharide export system protein LptC